VELTPLAAKQLAQYEALGFGNLPICMAKTQYSLSHDGALKGRPTGFRVPIREVRLSAGAGFVTPLAGEMRTMPGLPSKPGGENIDLDANGEIVGLF
jgi:formyltetrahydrofolate synthetase